MTSDKETTEEKILLAAEEIFLRDGYAGSRMQEIADLAGINKALLHYYFRSKDKLFEKIFDEKIELLFPKLEEMFEKEISFEDLICAFVEKYIALLSENPYLPLFVITIANRPDNQNFMKKLPVSINKKLVEVFMRDVSLGKIRSINPLHFIVSVIGMCAFPFIAKPVIMEISKANEAQYQEFLKSRVAEIQGYIRVLLKL
jgi:TetR/AcrR family transcriptional regulator